MVKAYVTSQGITLKAPSLAINCGCQCDSFIFRDRFGQTQGNCRSTDRSGARWCFVRPGNTCTDTSFFRGRTISNEACATPRCGNIFPNGFENNGFGEIGFGGNGFSNNGFGNRGVGGNGFGNNRFNNNGFGRSIFTGFGSRGFGNNGFRNRRLNNFKEVSVI
ncbi:unnamed protein product [Lepeophtheirus salmonis]|uniref:(salmon louse) hypothetical protein n=1 Tax=Lepeophtheirus salmonis TaxID=72036 RepID=A0A7R8CPU7_LEPSM|nr:unnamed protein product [Lepeophtheirus salmonis]CAF2854221.1 unnamed protein product [Lepeophtheirus salmonis]